MNSKLGLGTKAGYGLGMAGECLAMNTFYIFFIFFLTDAVGMNAGIAGTVSMIAVFWGAFTDLFAGLKTDASKNPNGRRRPFIYKAAIPLGVAIFLMYTDWSVVSDSTKPFYFLVAAMIFWLALSFTDIPYLSLGSEITDDYNERNSIRGIANIFNYAAMILASSGTLTLVSMMAGDSGIGDTGAWSKVGLIFGVLVLAFYWIAAAATKGKEVVSLQEEEAGPKTSIVKGYLEVLRIRPFRKILYYMVFAYGGVILFTSAYIYYLYYNMYFTDAQAALVMLIYCFMVMGASAVLGYIKIEKKNIVVSLTLLLGAGMIIAHFTGLNTFGLYLIFFLFALAISAYFVQIYSMVYDVCDVDAFINGGGREGVIVSMFYFVGKVVGGVAMAAVGWILAFVEYDPMLLEQAAKTLTGISFGALLLPGILAIIGALLMIKYPINQKNFDALQKATEAKKDGKEYSVDEFKELI